MLATALSCAIALLLGGFFSEPAAASSARGCDRAVGTALARCFDKASRKLNRCYVDSGAACADGEFDRDRERLARRVQRSCGAADLSALGYGAGLNAAGLTARLEESCVGDAVTLAARTFGGPQAATLAAATAATRTCVEAAATGAARLMRDAVRLQSRCLRRAHRGANCDLERLNALLDEGETRLTATIGDACADLRGLTGMYASEYIERAQTQARCMVASAHAETASLGLDCGPRAAVPVPPRGQWTQVVLDESVWGTRCGDGSPYAFWYRLAPSGAPLENVIVDLQGGGVCTNESECLGVSAGLFRSLDNTPPSGSNGGYRSTDPAINPFWDWTMILLPYCTQDVYAGGGLTNVFPGITVHRFGAVNLRAGVRYLRDVLWQEMDASQAEGYRPDRLRVLFGGNSAGGFGVTYNYHYLLDDLRWVNTTAAPDSALGLSNGNLVGLLGLGILINGTVAGWGGFPYQAPYCLSSACAVVPYRQTLTAARLAATPYQHFLNISNQVDTTQSATSFFPNSAAWTNAARQAYCSTQGLPGVHSFLPAIASPLHGIIQNSTRFAATSSDGVTVRDFLAAAMADPDSVVDRVEEGTLAGSASIDPFPCTVD